jgi:hypothetical protein
MFDCAKNMVTAGCADSLYCVGRLRDWTGGESRARRNHISAHAWEWEVYATGLAGEEWRPW